MYKYRHIKFLSRPPLNHIPNIHSFVHSFLPFSIFIASFLYPLHLSLCSSTRRVKMADCNRGEGYFSSQGHEGASKYGGLVPKKKPLISKDHERAFFDSADWALCKQGAGENKKSTAAVETLRPKLQRTPHQQLPPRRPACVSGKDTLEE